MKTLFAPLALLALLAGASAQAALVLETTEAGALASDSTVSIQALDDRDPWEAQAQRGGARAEFSLVTGLGRSFAATANPATTTQGVNANVGFFFSIRNTGLTPVSFEAGAISVAVDAAFDAVLGSGLAGHSLVAGGFLRRGNVAGAQGLLNLNYADNPITPTLDLFLANVSNTGNADVLVRRADPQGLDVLFTLGEFTLLPNRLVTVEFEFSALLFAAEGNYAEFDAWNTMQLNLRLPEGTTLEATRPLGWVSAVPEPAGALLWCAGGLALAALLRRRAATAPPARA